jgi:hypothetical protein
MTDSAEILLEISRLYAGLVGMVFALCSVIGNAEAENMPYRGKRKKFFKEKPYALSGCAKNRTAFGWGKGCCGAFVRASSRPEEELGSLLGVEAD